MDVDHPFIMGINNIRRENVPPADVLGDFRGEIIPHRAVDNGILVGVLLFGNFAVMPEQGKDLLVRAVLFPQELVPEPVLRIDPCYPVMFALIQFIDDHVLDFLNTDSPCKLPAP